MIRRSIYKKFYPSENGFDSLSLREQEQLPLLIGSNLVFMIAFVLFGITLALFGFPIIGGVAAFLVAFFTLSLYYTKHGHIQRGAWVTTIAIVVVTIVVCFGSKYKDTNILPYRSAFLIAAMTVCNYQISLSRKQIYVYFLISFAIWIADNLINYAPLYAAELRPTSFNVIICSLGIVVLNIDLLLVDRFNRKVVTRAATNEEKSKAALGKVSAVIEESKAGLDIGKLLSASTGKATDSIGKIAELYSFLNKETLNLRSETTTVKDSSSKINNQAEEMKISVQDQSNSIAQTSAALAQMSANITNISSIASKRKVGMDNSIHSLDSQLKLLEDLVNDVEKVKKSSAKVSEFVETVNNIASQTGLLAMNASIEAAHAGTLGKGFSVIAQEIRKLSTETTKNAEHITDTLKENGTIVNSTADSVSSFSSYTKTITNELRSTIQSIEEILAGISEIDSGTQEVMKSISDIVANSGKNSSLVENVASEITQQSTALENISGFTETLQRRVSSLDALLQDIKNAISEIEGNASANAIVAEKISNVINQ